ncbi:MAG: glycoside hydrolase N-terminal domain-containing protein [Cyclobacteriaceae bacterium]|nr:glycoside hydrolase N-terminal domain-containing protein [Cyclobacteriaceae bacterium]
MKTYTFFSLSFLMIFFSCSQVKVTGPDEKYNLVFTELATTWDEAMPLGNGMVGKLIWEKNGRLRFSLDRADLWDLRPMENIDFERWKFKDVYRHWEEDTYEAVQAVFDVPYNQLPAPSKIPAGALEFDIEHLGKIKSVKLDLRTAICVVEWENGARLTAFVHAEQPVGWYTFENLQQPVKVFMDSPAYNRSSDGGQTDQSPNELNQLGYAQGEIESGANFHTYHQKGWGDFSYQIHTEWRESENSLTGCWSVSSSNSDWEPRPKAKQVVSIESEKGLDPSFKEHLNWWSHFWSKSDISIPDFLLQKQYYLEMYKFGSAARADAPPISLQAVWTADHGKLPPWKGDFHHDLNTQLSYWPSYAGNYLDLEEGFINWLWKYRQTFKKFTYDFYETEGLNVPGVTTLEGEPMGGWIQYSMGPTVSAWLGHHFYLHWRYSMDRKFLEEKAYPWMKEVSVFIDQFSIKQDGIRRLPLSSSPEIFDNSREAWFAETTNYDLALIRWTYEKTAEMARELDLHEEADKWEQALSEWPQLAADPKTGLMFSPDIHYESHRHFSHLMGFHPLGLLDFSKGESDRQIILKTLDNLEKQGTDEWVGYSFSWQGNLLARAFQGDKAAEVLRIFAECFCLKNSFHVNGDQCKAGHAKRHYRPFTLEGNFAFASAIQEMLIQSHTGVVMLFPAIPSNWSDVSFSTLRTNGAFLISAELKEGTVNYVEVTSENAGEILLENPFGANGFKCRQPYEMEGSLIKMKLTKGQSVVLNKK